MDIQIVHRLLNPDSFKVPKGRKKHGWLSPKRRKSSALHEDTKPDVDTLIDATKKVPKILQGGDPIIIGHGQDSPPESREGQAQSSEERLRDSIDRPKDSSEGSRVTSTTWSSTSRRIFTNSSGCSQGQANSRFIEEYNVLAMKSGIPQLTAPADVAGGEIHSHAESTSKSHRNWLVRKFIRRAPSSDNIKAKPKHKPLKRAISARNFSSILEHGKKEILQGKSLEEIGRLGGLSILALPHDFAVDKLTLPTCLSATATYLSQHGCTTPGIFRVPGQLNTVNALYDYYAHQFANASNPDHIQQTVGSGLLPTHIPYTVHDVASVFKKIIAGLPGGLLGSLSLFAALRSIAEDLKPDPELSDPQFTTLKARLIALAISSVTSAFRVSLICAILGLASLCGHEAEKAITETSNEEKVVSSEFMSYQALGVVLGPLLLGDLTGSTETTLKEPDGARLPVSNSSRASKKQKQPTATSKFETTGDLLAQVDQAKNTAMVTQMLLTIWRDVVEELRRIDSRRIVSSVLDREHGLAGAQRRLAMRSSEEELLFEILRGRPVADDPNGSLKVKQKVTLSSRSPRARKAGQPRDNSANGTWFPEPIEEYSNEELALVASTQPSRDCSGQSALSDSSIMAIRSVPKTRLSSNESETSNAAMEEMTRGIMLMRPLEIFASNEHDESAKQMRDAHDVSGIQRSLRQSIYELASAEPGKVQDTASMCESVTGARASRDTDESLPLKPQRRVRDTYSGSTGCDSGEKDTQTKFPVRKSSLVQVKTRTPTSTANLHARDQSSDGSRVSEIFHDVPNPEMAETKEELIDGTGSFTGGRQNSVRRLAQRFSNPSKAHHGEMEAADSTIPKIHAYIHTLPQNNQTRPLTTNPMSEVSSYSACSSPGKDSLIPKPLRDHGRSRKDCSGSPSSAKKVASRNQVHSRPSIYNILPREDTEIVEKDDANLTQSPPQRLPPPTNPDSSQRASSISPAATILDGPKIATRSLSAYSSESLRRMRAALEEPPIAQHIPRSRVSTSHMNSYSQHSQPQPTPPSAIKDEIVAESMTLSPRASLSGNATLYAEIRRLQRLLDAKGEEIIAVRRSLEAVRGLKDAKGKGQLSEEIREARREAKGWRVRAEWAEKRLASLTLENERVNEIPVVKRYCSQGEMMKMGEIGEVGGVEIRG